jgi:two-component system, OmpR family, response regulator VicR
MVINRRKRMKALIIEDDENVAEAVSLCFQLRWPEITLNRVTEGKKGIDIISARPVDIIILDINLPDMSGFEVLKNIRGFSNVPVIILTVLDKEDEQVHGLELGADDYIIKPFRPRDLIARVNSVLRRTNSAKLFDQSPVITLGSVSLNLSKNEVKLDERVEKLTPNETHVLYTLMSSPGNTISSEQILKTVWGEVFPDNNRVRTYIRRLRLKLNDDPPLLIKSKRGKGYSFITPK